VHSASAVASSKRVLSCDFFFVTELTLKIVQSRL